MIHFNSKNTSQKRTGVPSQPPQLSDLKWGSSRFDTRGSKRGLGRKSLRPYTSLSLSLSLPHSFLSLCPSIFFSLRPRGPSSSCEGMNDVIQVHILTQRFRKA